MFEMAKRIVFTDIDNTLYDWAAFFAPSFRALVYVIARELSLPEDQIYDECKQVFAHRRSLDYPYLVQELDSVRRLSLAETRRLVGQGRGAFRSVQRKRLKPYPGVVETLRWLRFQNVTVVAITNSPMFRAQQRLWDLRLDSLLDGLVAWEGTSSDGDPTNAGFVPSAVQRRRSRLSRCIPIPLSNCKPNEAPYIVGLESFGGRHAEAWAVGDSLAKDLRPAAKLGIKTVWARYGAGMDPEERDASTLLKITHWTESEIRTVYSTEGFEPDYTVDSLEELRRIVPVSSLF
jgi:FMN phosphatase YigB (HAD superfamily)